MGPRALAWFSLFVATVFSTGAHAVGIKRRMQDASEAASEPTGSAAASSTEAPPRRGGVRQRLSSGHSQPQQSRPQGDQPLIRSLTRDWAKGEISSAKVQEYAWGAVQQGARAMADAAAIGNYGANPQNAFRALTVVFGTPQGAPAVQWIDIPTKHGKRTPHPFLLPHEFFSSFFSERPTQFSDAMAGPAGACAEFWKGIKHTDFVKRHPQLPRAAWGRTIPLGMHGDGASFSHHDSLYTFSWNSLLGVGTTTQKRFVFTVVKKSDMVVGTLDAIFKVFAWSVNALLSGDTPSQDADGRRLDGGGRPLADGWRGALCQIRGDWAFYKEVFDFPQWSAAERMCFLCRASSKIRALAWTNCGPEAGWRSTRWSHETYIEFLRGAGLAIPVLLWLVIGFRLECVMVDVLHTVDQGIASHIVGNVLWYMAVVKGVLGGETIATKVELLDKHLNAWYKANKCSSKIQGKLSHQRLRSTDGWPKLKAKAAATRHLAKYALHLAQTFASADERPIVAVCQLLTRFYEILESESMFLGAAARAELPRLGQQLAVIYSGLASRAAANLVKAWKMTPKMHLFLHLCEWQSLDHGNPRYYWTYADEDLAGLMAEVAESCHPRTMAASALFKWLHLAFEG